MAKVTKTLRDACRLLRSRVLYQDAILRLPGSSLDDDDTLKIQLATDSYVNSWIIPLIDAIESADTNTLKDLIG